MDGPRKSGLASEDWILEQQLRAELEAEAWRRLRQDLSRPALPPPSAPPSAPAPAAIDYARGGSLALKALVRFGLAVFGGYLAWLAAFDAGLGEFETWLALGAGFLVVLALSMLPGARHLVHLLAETLRWTLIVSAALGVVWLMVRGAP